MRKFTYGEAKRKIYCSQCGREFERFASMIRDSLNYCSRPCSRLASRNRTVVQCGHCGTELEKAVSQTRGVSRHYCNRSCRRLANLGENNPSWRGGKKRRVTSENYAKYSRWRRAVLRRDENSCQICGRTTQLEVHHVIEWRLAPELRFVIENGKTVCKSCHDELHPWRKTCELVKRLIS